ncbi:DUF998 domain-containing protein [Sulfitobacter sp. F26169L]|uniref:DUF998 domain-containing protein n=1 Tax=Sulfitobacter sp. F26169L TaxID=2996015 RepID=UPI002260EA13|nr:DUF998 domain-containing protein [Sulfitobacter sp. F26169L]MCX7567723.1 DUF998 domain-containing protein [Sulfitobacter sp. F26169L]
MRFSSASIDSHLLTSCGIIAILGAIAMVLGNVVGSIVVPDHDWIADTVSDLAAGKYEIIQDVALYGYAATLIACAIGASHLHMDGTRWNLGIGSLALLAMCVVIIGARNEYGDQDNEGIVIHIYVVYVLGLLFALLFLLMARGMARAARRYAVISYCCAALWIIAAPIFFVMPTGYDGAFERGLGIITIIWVTAFAWLLIAVAQDRLTVNSYSEG